MAVVDKVEVRVAVDADLAREAARQGIDPAPLLEAALRRALTPPEDIHRWAEQDAEAIASFDRYIESAGPFYRPLGSE